MKLPINWLKKYIEIHDPQDLIEKLTSVGFMQDGPPKKQAGDIVYDVEVRQNRSDCLSIIGLAREAGAVMHKVWTDPTSSLGELPDIKKNTEVTIADSTLCYRFNTLTITGLHISDSPEWLKNHLEAYGIKSINNVVDITNFVMVELGQPLHAFDARYVKDHHIYIRTAKKDEKLIVLGNKTIALSEDDLVIADSEKPLALAGIIGGEESGVHEDTTTIILETATYNQSTVRRSSIRHSIRTEASTRLEKFLHPSLTEIALKRAAQLLVEHANGKIVDHTDNYPKAPAEKIISVKLMNVNRLGGVTINLSEAESILKSLSIPYEPISDEELLVTVPYFRTDLEQEADIIEELIRIHGYDTIPQKLPSNPPPLYIQSVLYDFEQNIQNIMVACGFDEVILDPLTKEDEPELTPVKLENSLNSEKIMLRTTLRYNLSKAVEEQKKYRKVTINLFEVGKIYFQEDKQFKEKKVIGAISYQQKNSYSYMKGIVELLFNRLNRDYSDDIVKIMMINSYTYFFQIDTQALYELPEIIKERVLTEPPILNLQDLSLFVPEDTKVGALINDVRDSSNLIYTVELGEQPTAKNGEKTVFLHIAFHSPDKSLTNEDIEPDRKKIITMLEDKYQAKLR